MENQTAVGGLPQVSGLTVAPISGLTRVQIWRHTLPHALPMPAILWNVRGNARVILAGRALGIGPNTCVVLPAHTGFSIEPGSQCQAHLVTFPNDPLCPLPDKPRVLRLGEIATQGELSGLIDRIATALRTREPGYERAAFGRAMLVSALIDRLIASAPDTQSDSASHRLAERFTQEVERSFDKGATLNEIGAALDVTPTHLTRTLKQTCDRTAAQYLNERVMHAARCALADTKLSAADISRGLGFSSPAYFSRAFLSHAEQTPGAFRSALEKRPVANVRSSMQPLSRQNA